MTIKAALALIAMLGASPVMAQDNGNAVVQPDAAIDPATLTMPNLAFNETPAISGDYDKYYYFHRVDTNFAEAHADLLECDALASGISARSMNSEPFPGYYATYYGIGGVIGGAIGNAAADAIYGSAERRRVRRINMRNCMGFKGYSRYGLAKNLWVAFNFEEGMGREKEDVRQLALAQQAMVASGPKPAARVLEL